MSDFAELELYNYRNGLIGALNEGNYNLTWDGVPVKVLGDSGYCPEAILFEKIPNTDPRSHNFGLPSSPLAPYRQYGQNKWLYVPWETLQRVLEQLKVTNTTDYEFPSAMYRVLSHAVATKEFNCRDMRNAVYEQQKAKKEEDLLESDAPYFLVKYSHDWSDEFEVEGLAVKTRTQVRNHIRNARKKKTWDVEVYFGTNEFIDYTDSEDYLNSFTYIPLTREEAKIIKRTVGDKFGHYLDI